MQLIRDWLCKLFQPRKPLTAYQLTLANCIRRCTVEPTTTKIKLDICYPKNKSN